MLVTVISAVPSLASAAPFAGSTSVTSVYPVTSAPLSATLYVPVGTLDSVYTPFVKSAYVTSLDPFVP